MNANAQPNGFDHKIKEEKKKKTVTIFNGYHTHTHSQLLDLIYITGNWFNIVRFCLLNFWADFITISTAKNEIFLDLFSLSLAKTFSNKKFLNRTTLQKIERINELQHMDFWSSGDGYI